MMTQTKENRRRMKSPRKMKQSSDCWRHHLAAGFALPSFSLAGFLEASSPRISSAALRFKVPDDTIQGFSFGCTLFVLS